MNSETQRELSAQIKSPPAPNVIGKTRMQITETHWFTPAWPPGSNPVKVVKVGIWEVF